MHAGANPSAVTAARDVRAAADVLVDVASRPAGLVSLSGWADLVVACQEVLSVVTAAQDAAITRLAALDVSTGPDGQPVEQVNPLGWCSMDVAPILGMRLAIGATHARTRVEEALSRCGEELLDSESGEVVGRGLHGLHAGMVSGRLDPYKARVIARAVEGDVPTEVVEAIVEALDPWFDRETAPHLRRRAQRLMEFLCPEAVRQQVEEDRKRVGLRRWASSTAGVDEGYGRFPCEDAVTAWAAIDQLAREYVRDGVRESLERARGKALTDLVTGAATVTATVQVTVPADVLNNEDDLDEGDGGLGDDDAQPTGADPDDDEVTDACGGSAYPMATLATKTVAREFPVPTTMLTCVRPRRRASVAAITASSTVADACCGDVGTI